MRNLLRKHEVWLVAAFLFILISMDVWTRGAVLWALAAALLGGVLLAVSFVIGYVSWAFEDLRTAIRLHH